MPRPSVVRRVGLVVGVLIWSGSLFAQQGLSTFERITVAGSAVGIATATTNPTGRSQMNTCSIGVEGGGVYIRDDGTDPTASNGWPLTDGDVLAVTSNVIARALRFISSSATTTYVSVRCYP